jgi:hypothetical protein
MLEIYLVEHSSNASQTLTTVSKLEDLVSFKLNAQSLSFYKGIWLRQDFVLN